MFVDASVLVAILAAEDGSERLMARLQASGPRFTSPIVIYEAVLALKRITGLSSAPVMQLLLEFLQRIDVSTIDVKADYSLVAISAHDRFGKGTGSPARLNMGDCFSYAAAKSLGVPLVYKGNDFAHTDLA